MQFELQETCELNHLQRLHSSSSSPLRRKLRSKHKNIQKKISFTPNSANTSRFPMARLRVLQCLTLTLVMFSIFSQTEGKTESRKLDETTPPDLETKCGGCPCNNPCNPPPSPPPPSPPPPSPPPPPKKLPPSNYCPPPPSGGQYPPNPTAGNYPPSPPYMYVNGPPGNLYPVDSYYSGSDSSFCVGLFPFAVSIAFGLLAFW